jgi:hypothetical protein
MRGIFLLGLGLVLLVWVGCGRKITASSTTEVKDSTYIKEVPRLVSFTSPASKVMVKEFIKCDPRTNKPIPTKISGRNGQANEEIDIDSTGLLTGTAQCDSLKGVIEVKDKEIYHLRQQKETTTKVVTEFKTRSIDSFCRWFTGIGIVIAIALIFNKLKKISP